MVNSTLPKDVHSLRLNQFRSDSFRRAEFDDPKPVAVFVVVQPQAREPRESALEARPQYSYRTLVHELPAGRWPCDTQSLVRDALRTLDRRSSDRVISPGHSSYDTATEPAPNGVWDFTGLRIDLARREVYVAEKPISLTCGEFDLLAFLASKPGVVFSRNQIILACRGDQYVDERAINVQIFYLRRKLGAVRDYVQTVRGVGYRFVAEKVF